jgi:hypothetical protein
MPKRVPGVAISFAGHTIRKFTENPLPFKVCEANHGDESLQQAAGLKPDVRFTLDRQKRWP